jgi:uncharacterized protein YndB with AHSA1/START domain
MSVPKAFTISRIFKAPRELVFKMHTEPEHMAKWLGPPGSTVIKADMDLRVGGSYHYGVRTQDGHEMWGKQIYREILVPEKLVFVQSFSDRDGGLTRHPMSPSWPRQMLSTVTFEDLGGTTKLTINWIPLDPDDAEADTFNNAQGNLAMGFKGSFDQLENYLAAF